jgi:hypothetical protein
MVERCGIMNSVSYSWRMIAEKQITLSTRNNGAELVIPINFRPAGTYQFEATATSTFKTGKAKLTLTIIEDPLEIGIKGGDRWIPTN